MGLFDLFGKIEARPNTARYKKDDRIFLGQPEKDTSSLVRAVVSLCSGRGEVEAVYMAQVYNQSSGEQPHLILGISVNMESESLFRDLHNSVKKNLGQDEFVEIIAIGDDGISDYLLKETSPIYKK